MVKEQRPLEPCARDYTIHLHKKIHSLGFKKRAPRAVKEIRDFAQRVMKTEDVRIDAQLNRFVWSQGIRNVPYRVRVRMTRKKVEDNEELMYTLVQYVPVDSFAGLRPERVAE